MGFLALLMLAMAACAPVVAAQPGGPDSDKPAAPAESDGMDPDKVLLQLTFEPGFSLPEFRYPFGRTPYFTLLANGRVIYVDESQDFKVMQAQLTPQEAEALRKQVLDLGFARLESHTDMCGKLADGSEPCIADAATSVLRVLLDDGSLREIRNYANFSNEPATYDAIYNLLNDFAKADAAVYVPHAATLFVRIVPTPEMSSPADWPLNPAYVERALAASDQFTAVVLNAEEAALWQKNVGIDNNNITFQLDGKPVAGFFVPWLPGEDYTADIAAAFPQ